MKKLASSSTFRKRRSWHLVPSLYGKYMGKQWKQWQTLFSRAPKSLQMVTAAMKLKDTCSFEEKLWQMYRIKKEKNYFADKSLSSQSYGFSRSCVWMWELDHEEGWAPKNWYFWTVGEDRCWRRLLKVPWTARRSNQSILKEISPEYSLEGAILKLKLQYFGHLMQRADPL